MMKIEDPTANQQSLVPCIRSLFDVFTCSVLYFAYVLILCILCVFKAVVE